MTTIDPMVCMEELIRQCEVALEAIGQLNYALMNLYQVPSGGSQYNGIKKEVFDIIYIFLGSAGQASRMLWPDMENKKNGVIGVQTDDGGHHGVGSFSCSTLRRRIGAAHKQLLKILNRNRIPQSLRRDKGSERRREPDTCHIIGSPIAVRGYSSPRRIRIYDPTTRNFYTNGEIYPLQEIAAAIACLQSCAHGEENLRRGFSQHHFHAFSESCTESARL